MDDAALSHRHHESHKGFVRHFATAIVHPRGSVLAGITPEAPDRSLPNSVIYDDPADVIAAIGELARLYDAAGVRAWTVWVQPGDDELAAALMTAGHAHDGQPMRMAAPLAEMDLEPRSELDIRPTSDWEVVGALNDRAYEITGLREAFGRFRPDGAVSGWLAYVDGEPAASVATSDTEGDAYVFFVATAPEARGRGLCGGLMRHALGAAQAAGCTTTSLEGSPMGEPVYAAMGYRSLGRYGLYERRVRNESA